MVELYGLHHLLAYLLLILQFGDLLKESYLNTGKAFHKEQNKMKEHTIGNESEASWFKSGIPFDQFYSVEFSIAGHYLPYQFKIWNLAPQSMYVLVKESSEILGCLKAGDIVRMKYYTTDSLCPTKDLDTKIEYITKEDHGRLKGHFLVGLMIIENRNDKTTH